MKHPGKNIVFPFLEFLGLTASLGLAASLIRFVLGTLLGLEGLINILLYWLLFGVAAALLAFAARRVIGGWTWKDLGFKVRAGWGGDIWYGLVTASLIYILTLPLEMIILPSVSAMAAESMSGLMQMPFIVLIPAAGVLSLVFGFVTGAFHEEIWYRGYIQGLFTREAAPAAGFLFSLILFSLLHAFSHPEWSLLNVLNTVPHAFFFCLAYYATGSLLVCMTAHTLCNFFVPTIAVPLYAKGLHGEAYIALAAFSLLFLGICILGRRIIKELAQKTVGLFKDSGWRMNLLGIGLGAMALLFTWVRGLLRSRAGGTAYFLVLAGFAILTLGTAILYGKKHKKAGRPSRS
jgi:membrane protease YdiL (CAAX protease family)